jgi:hypothetical protein
MTKGTWPSSTADHGTAIPRHGRDLFGAIGGHAQPLVESAELLLNWEKISVHMAGEGAHFQRRGISLESRVRAINKARSGMAIA